jgi:hypothetical protein
MWLVGVLGFVGLVLFLTADIWRSSADGTIPIVQPGALGAAPQVDLASMTPREAADRLFNRVVQAAELGDSVEVRTFLPMALSAYEIARPMDTDGEFHLTVLQRIGDLNEGALIVADSLLATDPTHLLLLSSAAEAARSAGDSIRAADYYQRLLDAYAAESAAPRQEYVDHPGLLPEMPARAREFLGIGG